MKMIRIKAASLTGGVRRIPYTGRGSALDGKHAIAIQPPGTDGKDAEYEVTAEEWKLIQADRMISKIPVDELPPPPINVQAIEAARDAALKQVEAVEKQLAAEREDRAKERAAYDARIADQAKRVQELTERTDELTTIVNEYRSANDAAAKAAAEAQAKEAAAKAAAETGGKKK